MEATLTGTAVLSLEGVDLNKPFTTNEAARLCGVAVETIRTWVHRGRLTATGTQLINGREHPTYRWIDLVKAEAGTRERARR